MGVWMLFCPDFDPSMIKGGWQQQRDVRTGFDTSDDGRIMRIVLVTLGSNNTKNTVQVGSR